MNCQTSIQQIEKHFGEEKLKLDHDLWHHLSECEDCMMVYKAFKRASSLVKAVRDFDPELPNPISLTDSIMEGVERISKENGQAEKNILISLFQGVAVRRILSAAAVILFAVFTVEQYVVLDKINHLENQYQKVSNKVYERNNSYFYDSWETRTLNKFNNLKVTNKELFDKLNSTAGKVLLSKIYAANSNNVASQIDNLIKNTDNNEELQELLNKIMADRKLSIDR
jgi:hypothetical protein